MHSKNIKNGSILVHGGCGAFPPTPLQMDFIRKAIDAGHAILEKGGAALDAVEAAVMILEKSGRFNAGKGAKRQMDGVARMDASLMDGKALSAGAVAGVENVLTPIRAARLVMEKTPHLLLAGRPAERLARLFHVAPFPPSLLKKQRQESRAKGQRTEKGSFQSWGALARKLSGAGEEFGTVGAVARDLSGNVAAGTSTGGINLMLPGRVGDTPLIGAGTYADNLGGAVSMTGQGEAIIRAGVAKEISIGLELGLTAEEAGRRSLIRMQNRTGGEAGALVLSAMGDFEILHTTRFMPAGFRYGRESRIAGRFRRVREE